ncbi:MAG: hypothetical protein L0323_10045, partial [Planctomycetes bacterium]|nr:hypothetical protein [Planctomycetota bacterium]
MDERIAGRVARWGARGYGFIDAPGLERPAWFHLKFIEDGRYEPREGDLVTFLARRLLDGRVQALGVRPASAEPALETPAPPRLTSPLLSPRLRDRLLAEVTSPPAAQPVPAPVHPTPPRLPPGLRGRIEAARREREDDSGREADLAERRERAAVEADRRREELARQLEAATREAGEARRAAREARQRADRFLEEAPAAEAEIAAGYLREAHVRVVFSIGEGRRGSEALAAARTAAVALAGEEAVARYEEARRRLRRAVDPEEREAFGLLERERRAAAPPYARALEAAEGRGKIEVPVVAFSPAGSEGAAVLVLCVQASELEQDPAWRLACAFWGAVRGAYGDGAAPGDVVGLLALRVDRFRGEAEEREFLAYALDEAIATRPSLARWGLAFALEVAPVEAPDFAPTGGEEADRTDPRPLPPATGGSLREIALRLGLALHDTFEAAHGRGLAGPDDFLDAGSEETLRALFGLERQPAASPVPPATDQPATPRTEASAPGVPERILGKLLRDHRIGGRHT